MGATAVIADGRGLPVGGTSQQVTALNANVGPNALLASASYPAPSSASSGPLTLAPLPVGFTFWRINSTPGSGQFTLPNLWSAGATTPYVLSNSPANLGGIVPAGGMVIDGYPVVAGTYVFQFMDLSLGGFLLLSGGPPVMFRGCRIRAAASSPGFFNSETGGYTGQFYAHFCDFGGAGPASECDIALQVTDTGGQRLLRNYISWVGSGIIPSAPSVFCDVIENLIEDITLFTGTLHLNGLKFQGGDTNCRWLRNCIVFDRYDALGNQVTQTDPVGLIPTFGAFAGTGINSDGSTGYFIQGNFVGGGGYCMYLGSNSSNSPVSNMTLTGNLWTAGQWPNGGANGASAFAPPSGWGASGNSQSANLWADGPNAGMSVI
jgi:hypothetical protein